MTTFDALLIGGPTVHWTYAGLTVLTDPTFDPAGDFVSPNSTLRKLAGPAVTAESLGAIDLVLLSHDQHADNLDLSGRALLPDAGLVLSTPDAPQRIEHVTGMAPWESHTITTPDGGTVVVTAVPARHGPEGCERLTGLVTGFLLQSDGWPTVYVTGDNASLDHAADIAARFPGTGIVLAFAGAGDVGLWDRPLTLDSAGVAALAALFPSAVVAVAHCEDWEHFREGPDDVRRAVERAGVADRVIVLERGRRTSLG
jgi:L-ascorbate metabolism protein UlaG (beta-lactamase superfamily)